MKATYLKSYGGVEAIDLKDVPKPRPNRGQILVEVIASSINPFDLKLAQGMFKDTIPLEFPAPLGTDLSGIVREKGEDVKSFDIGDEIFGSADLFQGRSGSFAEFALVKPEKVTYKPSLITFEEASALPLVGVSALQAIEEHIRLKVGEKILIHGGAGGIGHIAIQLAKSIGAYVITTTSTTNMKFVKDLGADEVIDYKTSEFEKIVGNLDAVFDTVGGEVLEKSLQVLKEGGILVSMLGMPSRELLRKYKVSAIAQNTQVNAERLQRLSKYVEEGKIKVSLDKVFSLSKIKEAFKYFEDKNHRGKVVVRVKD